MLRIECLPRLANACLTLTPRIFAIGLGVAVTGCSADISRFDAPMFGLTESGNRVAAAPIPREGVLANRAESTSYDRNYDAPSRSPYPVASLPDNRNQSGYQSYTGTSHPGHQGGSAQSGYNAPSYQPSYTRPPQDGYQRTPPYEPRREQPTRVAALPPSTPADSHRPLSWHSDAAATSAPSQKASHPVATTRPVTGNSREIEVQPGDTLYSLAQRHGASISELMSLNGLRSPAVHPGQKIILPERASAVASAVRRAPASKTDSTRVAVLTESADARVSQREQPAAVVRELSPEPPPLAAAGTSQQAEAAYSPGDTYTMKNGDSLYGIAVRHRISLAQLQEINNITDPRKVRAGTVLKLPSSSATPTTVAQTPDRRPQLGSHADTTTAPQTAAASANSNGEAVAKPTIINAPASAPGQRVASLDNTGTTSDAAPSPLTLPSPSAESESGQGSEATKAEAVGKFRWPVRGKVITGFGQQPDGSHSDGIKLAVPLGTEVHAAESGVVAYAGNELKGYGNLVLLRHDNGWITAYAHNNELSVKRGDRVRRGQVIAKAGNSGSTDKPQLHFELRQGSSPVDPVPHLEKL